VPIYEFYCPDCHRVFSFLSRTVDTARRPACPRCHRADLSRRVSLFAISKGRAEPTKAPTDAEMPGLPPGMDEHKLQAAMESLAHEAEGLDESDPRQGIQLMRRLFEATGMPIGKGMEEALRRIEGGEDPDKVEEEMGDLLEDALGLDGGAETPSDGRRRLGSLRRALPPSVDPELHEL
jgi:putative FmdB family regulatory protein